MANETTTTSQAANNASEILSAIAIRAALPKMVLASMVHRDDLGASKSNKKRYRVNSDLGQSSGGIEGVALTPTVEITQGSSVEMTVSEGVADMALITELAASTALGVEMDEVQRIFLSGTQEQYEALLAEYIERLIPRGMQKIEADLLALLLGISTTVGSSGVDATIANLLSLIFKYRIAQAPRPITEARFLLAEQQADDVNREALSTNGGVGGSIWMSQADYGMANRDRNDETVGRIGSFLGYPVHTYDSELNQTANAGADVVGAFGVFGVPGVAPDAPSVQGKPGAFNLLSRGSLKCRFKDKLEHRGAGVVMNAYYAAGELVDRSLVALVTDAP